MKHNRALWSLFTCAATLLSACASNKATPLSADIEETAYRTHVSVLASDDFEGRRPGTAGEEKTVAYLIEQFRRLGLKPGNGESFLQQVPMVEILTSAAASLRIAGARGSLDLGSGKDVVLWSKRAAAQTQLTGSDLVFVGYGIVAPEYAWNDYAGADVRGKTVVALINDPGYGSKDPKVFKGGAMSYYGRWTYKIEEATRQGASAVLLIHDTQAAGYGWSVVQNAWSGPQFERATADGGAGRAALEGWIQSDAARALFLKAGMDFTALMAAATQPGFKAVPMNMHADVTLHNSIRQFTSANVIAVLPGGRHRECVLFTAHWDSLGVDDKRAGHAIFNGALDNASGVAGMLALAQSFVRTRPTPDRSLVFLAVTGGDYGQLGSEYYVENPLYPLRQTAAVIDLDTLHEGGPTRDVSVFGYGNTDLEDYARAAALLQGRELSPEPYPGQGLYLRSDSYTFASAGVPVLYAKAGVDDSARGPAWGRAQLEDYTARRYLQPSDQYSPDWDVRGTLDDLKLYYDVGLRVARGRRFPRWYPVSEYRLERARDRQP
jgi:Zn-dependent M28 family amino/carboxypeptidase